MALAGDLRTWLLWVIKIRFVIISLVFAIDYTIRELVPQPSDFRSIERLGLLIVLWYVLGLFYLIYHQISRDYTLQAYLQIYSDIAITTAIVHVTGDLESNYLSLYFVAIILASILLPRARAFLVAGVSFVCLGVLLELAYLPELYPQFSRQHPKALFLATASTPPVDVATLGVKISASLFGFLAVAYLTSYLAENLRKTGAELRHKAGQVASLHAINENIIHSMRGGLVRTDLEGRIRELNPAGSAILGRRAADLKGVSIAAVLPALSPPPADAAPTEGEAEGHADAGDDHGGSAPGVEKGDSLGPGGPLSTASRREILYRHPEKGQRILGLSASPLRMPDAGVVGTIYTFQDLTEEKQRAAEYRNKDRMATLGRLAAGIAHEIRNPLASIAGSVRLLQSMAGLDSDEAKLIDIVRRESARLDKLVSDFLTYAREQKFEFREADLVNLLEETLLLVEQHPAFARGCRLSRQWPAGPVLGWVDADRLRQVFWNICDNCLKAMPEGGVLAAGIVARDVDEVQVIISDTGVGFDPAQAERLFEPFHHQFRDGTGLGLAISRQIVEAHRGRIRAESEPGRGTRFVIDLPRKPVAAVAPDFFARSVVGESPQRE